MSPSSVSVHPARSISDEPGLFSSIHSSWELATVPAQATSLIRIDPGGYGVDGGRTVIVIDGVGVRVEVCVGVIVVVSVWEGVAVGVYVSDEVIVVNGVEVGV